MARMIDADKLIKELEEAHDCYFCEYAEDNAVCKLDDAGTVVCCTHTVAIANMVLKMAKEAEND